MNDGIFYKMAPNGGNSEELLLRNDVYQAIGDRYRHILMKIGSTTSDQILDLLVEDEDESAILETRDTVFNSAISKYATCNGLQNPDKGTSVDIQKIELKQRKGDRKLLSNAKDIYELFCYYVELRPDFPKDCIRCGGTYLDIAHTPKSNSIIKNDVTVNKLETQKLRSYSHADLVELVMSCNAKNQELENENKDMERQVLNVRAHLLSVEKILFDELRAIKSVADANKAAISGLKVDPSQNKPKPAGENIRSKPNSQKQQSADNVAHATHSQQTESSTQSSQESFDPSYTQLMQETYDPSGSSDDSDCESIQVDASPPPPKGPPPGAARTRSPAKNAKTSNKATSPTFTRFANGDNTNKSSIKPPLRRSAQKNVNDLNDNKCDSDTGNDGQWQEVSYGRKKSDKKSESESSGLKGIKSEPFAELYLTNIARRDNQSFSDIAEDIRKYGRSNGFRIMSAWVVANRVADDMVGCKLRVPIRQVDDMLGNRAWPAGIMCKRWEKREKPERKPDPSPSSSNSWYPNYRPKDNSRSRSSSSNRRGNGAGNRSVSRGSAHSSVRGRSGSHIGSTRSNSGHRSRRDFFDYRN